MPKTIPAVNLVDVTLGEVQSLTIQKGQGLEAEISYVVKTDGGEIHHGGTLTGELTGSTRDNLVTWINAKIIPAINSQEGMS